MNQSSHDIRWQQRLGNYQKALLQLGDAVKLSQQRALSNLEKQGLIQAFEFTHELAWNVIKELQNNKLPIFLDLRYQVMSNSLDARFASG